MTKVVSVVKSGGKFDKCIKYYLLEILRCSCMIKRLCAASL